jgi:hypothetical protein
VRRLPECYFLLQFVCMVVPGWSRNDTDGCSALDNHKYVAVL